VNLRPSFLSAFESEFFVVIDIYILRNYLKLKYY